MLLHSKRPTASDSHPELPLDPDAVQPGEYKWPPHLTPALQATVFLGGCAGTLARYGVIIAVLPQANSWPLATFVVNLLGSFVLGVLLRALFHLGDDTGMLRIARLAIGTGFIGAFTTYSSLAVETDLLIKNNHVGIATLYGLTSVIGGVIACAIGIRLATWHSANQRDTV